MRSKLDVQIGAGRPGLARQNQTVAQVVGFQDVACRHIHLTHDDGRHTRTAPALPARVARFDARVKQHVDQALGVWPAQTMALTFQLDLNAGDFGHEPMVRDQRGRAITHAPSVIPRSRGREFRQAHGCWSCSRRRTAMTVSGAILTASTSRAMRPDSSASGMTPGRRENSPGACPLIIRPGASTKWVWLPGPEDINREQLRSAIDPSGSVRVAVGGRAEGVDGFRRSHADAIAAQRMVARLESPQRLVFFDEVQLVALITSDAEGTERFVGQILGDLAYAPRDVRETVLAYVEEHGSVNRVAARQYTHRNTVVRRVARAGALLPRPLSENPVQVAAALQVLRWTGHGRSDRRTADNG